MIGDILSHEWAKNLVSNAQRIVTYFLASPLPLCELRKLIKSLDIKGGGLVSSNKTRFTSIHLVCCFSDSPLNSTMQAQYASDPLLLQYIP